jgi:hypothetical protein
MEFQPHDSFGMKHVINKIARIWPPRRLTFTLVMCGGLLIMAVLSGSLTHPLSPAWQDRLGFASSDLFTWGWERIFTSAMVTSGGKWFWLPFGLMLILTSVAEWLAGTRRTALAFWIAHLGATVGESLLTGVVVQFSSSSLLSQLHSLRDVGPSAGYFGCIGLITAYFPRPWKYLVGLAVITGLIGGMVYSAQHGAAIDVSAGLAHLLAFPIGWSVADGFFLKRSRT